MLSRIAKESLHKAHQRVANRRRNFCHHISKWLVGKYDLIAFEKLKIQAMAQSRFGKSIMDAAWGMLLLQIAYKAEEAGRHAIAVNPKDTTQICSGCGEIVHKELFERIHSCPRCGLILGRDHNSSINILRLGRSLAGFTSQ